MSSALPQFRLPLNNISCLKEIFIFKLYIWKCPLRKNKKWLRLNWALCPCRVYLNCKLQLHLRKDVVAIKSRMTKKEIFFKSPPIMVWFPKTHLTFNSFHLKSKFLLTRQILFALILIRNHCRLLPTWCVINPLVVTSCRCHYWGESGPGAWSVSPISRRSRSQRRIIAIIRGHGQRSPASFALGWKSGENGFLIKLPALILRSIYITEHKKRITGTPN